ncbi:MAG: SOS response-associated peptidase [Candidatus Shapirobacteria bacterium]
MCGRFALYPDSDFYSRFKLPEGKELVSYPNASPGQNLPLIVASSTGNRLISKLWGYHPVWSSSSRPLINARAETVTAKPAFKKAFTTSRCLVPASGYYEWQKTASVSNLFYFKDPDSKYLGLAGLYFDDSFVILTTTATPEITSIHDRMPLILPPASESFWLSPDSSPSDLMSLLSPQAPALQFQPV